MSLPKAKFMASASHFPSIPCVMAVHVMYQFMVEGGGEHQKEKPPAVQA